MGREHTAGEDDAFATDAGVFADVAAQFIAPGGSKDAIVGHAYFCCIMPEIAEDAATAYVDVIL